MRKDYETPKMLISVLNVQDVINGPEFGEGEDNVPWDPNWSSLLK